MKNHFSNKHLSLEERKIIETGIEHGSTKQSIADTIGKDPSTIGKEIALHRIQVNKCPLALPCVNYKKCSFEHTCNPLCPNYKPFRCIRRDRTPGACNGCKHFIHCRFDKFLYKPDEAQIEYHNTLVDSRVGANLSTNEAKSMADIISPLLKKGLSPFQIIQAHPELNISERTLYNYIDNGVFENFDIFNIHLRRKVSRRLPKKYAEQYKKRADNKYLLNRKYSDFNAYISLNPNCYITEMDTVYNDGSNGPFIQTFLIRGTHFLFAILHTQKTALSMLSGIDTIDSILGPSLFNKYFEVLLTDGGSEFSTPDSFEKRTDDTTRTRVFFCDPMCANQKGTIENRHEALRYILPKNCDLTNLGLINQTALNLVLSHINSEPLKSLNGKSPFEFIQFLHPELYHKFVDFGMNFIPTDKLILKPFLLKSFTKNS